MSCCEERLNFINVPGVFRGVLLAKDGRRSLASVVYNKLARKASAFVNIRIVREAYYPLFGIGVDRFGR